MCRMKIAGFAAAALLASGLATAAAAAGYPVSGTLTLDGQSGNLPAGSSFTSAGYDPINGEVAAGQFSFPADTISESTPFGTLVVTYQIFHENQSAAMVLADGAAMFDQVELSIEIQQATLSGIPISLGSCRFEPVYLDELAGTASATSLSVADPAFVVPAVDSTDCGGYGDEINDALAGSNNAMTLHIHGNFTAPPDLDLIFADGFELP